MTIRDKMTLSMDELEAEYPGIPVVLMVVPNDGNGSQVEVAANISRESIARLVKLLDRLMSPDAPTQGDA